MIAKDVPLPFAELQRFKDDDFNDRLNLNQSIIVQNVVEEESKEQPLRLHGQQIQRHGTDFGAALRIN